MKLITFYGSRGLRIVKGENQYVWDDKGKNTSTFTLVTVWRS